VAPYPIPVDRVLIPAASRSYSVRISVASARTGELPLARLSDCCSARRGSQGSRAVRRPPASHNPDQREVNGDGAPPIEACVRAKLGRAGWFFWTAIRLQLVLEAAITGSQKWCDRSVHPGASFPHPPGGGSGVENTQVSESNASVRPASRNAVAICCPRSKQPPAG
jgi:hypothetical protein